MKKYLDEKKDPASTLVKKSLIAKKEIIEIDEFENNSRKVLNYGHTFGHAIESASNYLVPHGIAVLLGMKVIHELGVKWEITDRKLAEEVNQYIDGILQQNNYLANLDLVQIQKLIWSDKKIKNKELTFIVLKTIGKFEFVRKLPSSNLTNEIENAFKRL
jgi:3-dehydroquinate synthase